jgi:cytidine deaminase
LSQFTPEVTKAYNIAKESREKAYCPYSKFNVGAAIKFKNNDKIYSGCNVENASYGATICAERTAVVSGIADQGKQTVEFVVVVTDTSPATQPCALCLQVLAEFSEPHTPIYLANKEKIETETQFNKLLPNPFTEFKV